jgi:hypothetical protein
MNIRGTTPGDTDLLMERLCSQKVSLTGVYGAYNVRTGEFKTMDEYLKDVFGLFFPVATGRPSAAGAAIRSPRPGPTRAR